MSVLDTLETKLNRMLVEDAPVQLPESWRQWMATYAWVFSLIGFIIGVFAIVVLVPALSIVTGVSTLVGLGSAWVYAWISLLLLVGYVFLLGVATSKLKRLEKSGWNLIFYSSIFFAAYDVVDWLRHITFGTIIGLIWNLAWTLLALYLIFQIRNYFLPKPPHTKTKAKVKK